MGADFTSATVSLYVSVHATEPESRPAEKPACRSNLAQLKWFQEQRLQIHAQVVLSGINDGVHLVPSWIWHRSIVEGASCCFSSSCTSRFNASPEDELYL